MRRGSWIRPAGRAPEGRRKLEFETSLNEFNHQSSCNSLFLGRKKFARFGPRHTCFYLPPVAEGPGNNVVVVVVFSI